MPGQCAAIRAIAGAEAASPPVHTSRSPAKQAGSSSASAPKSAVVRKTAVTPRPAARRTTGADRSSSATSTQPPFSSGTHTS